jgi:hypothetical protein
MACYGVVQHNEEMNQDEARRRFEAARVGRLVTVTSNRWPHLVPVVSALVDDFLYRQSTTDPRPPWRGNDWPILTRRAAGLLVDEYTEDWSTLWWSASTARHRS